MTRMTQGRNRKSGLPPGTAVHIGEVRLEQALAEWWHIRGDYSVLRKGLPDKLPVDGFVWIRIRGVHDMVMLRQIADLLEIHPLILEDIANTEQRAKYESYPEQSYLVLRQPEQRVNGHLSTEQVSLVFGRGFILSLTEDDHQLFQPVCRRLETGGIGGDGWQQDELIHALVDQTVDQWFEALEHQDEEIENLENVILTYPDRELSRRLHRLRRNIQLIHRSVWPMREAVASLARQSDLIRPEMVLRLRDVQDHTLQILDISDSLRDAAGSLLDMHLTVVGNKTNGVMRFLTVISTVFMPLSLLAGIYGMNFRHMPELEWSWSYPVFWVVMILLTVAMLLWFRRKKWL